MKKKLLPPRPTNPFRPSHRPLSPWGCLSLQYPAPPAMEQAASQSVLPFAVSFHVKDLTIAL